METPESIALENIAIEQAYERARKMLTREAINLKQFKGLYGEDVVKRDEKYVEEMEARFSRANAADWKQARMLAAIFEAVFHECAELSDWLGPEALTIKTSRFDDIRNGVDSVAEFRESDVSASYIALAIDVTISAEAIKKFKRIKKEIENGELAKVKYFISEHTNIRGELSKIPRVVIGADAKTIKELGELWLEKNNKILENHPVQFQVLEEISSQLNAFQRYAEKVNQSMLVAVYSKMHGLVQKISKEKSSSVYDSGYRDSAFYSFQGYLKNFSSL